MAEKAFPQLEANNRLMVITGKIKGQRVMWSQAADNINGMDPWISKN